MKSIFNTSSKMEHSSAGEEYKFQKHPVCTTYGGCMDFDQNELPHT
jgi:hypothetical protein